MSQARRPKNPFEDDDDEPNDFVFVPKGMSKPSEKKYDYGDFGYAEEDRESPNNGAYSLQSQIEDTQRNMLQSTQRSLGLMYEAEDVGNETAHELLRQGDQLRNIETKVDKINKDLDSSKRHVTAIRSVFGGVINYFQSKKAESEKPAQSSRAPGKLQSIVGSPARDTDQPLNDSEHPAMRLRDPSSRNYGSSGSGRYDTSGFQAATPGYPSASSRGASQHNSQMQAFDKQLDSNLDEMSSGLARLKNLGLGLGDEIERQNDDIDRITDKTSNVDNRIVGVNRDINKILRR